MSSVVDNKDNVWFNLLFFGLNREHIFSARQIYLENSLNKCKCSYFAVIDVTESQPQLASYQARDENVSSQYGNRTFTMNKFIKITFMQICKSLFEYVGNLLYKSDIAREASVWRIYWYDLVLGLTTPISIHPSNTGFSGIFT